MAGKLRKELVLDIIEKKESTPFAIDYMPARQTDEKLRDHLGFSMDQAGEKELLDYLGSDIYYLSARDISQNEGYHACWKKRPDLTETERSCAFGIRWSRSAGRAKFSVDESIAAPLAGVTDPKAIIAYPWPKREDFDFSPLVVEAEQFQERAIIGGLWTGILGDAYRMIGFQDFLLHIALTPDLIKTLVWTLTDVYLELNDAYFQALKGKLDIWFFGNDFGSQNGLLFSRPMWQEFFSEPVKELCSLAKSHGLRVMMHSCGSISPLIPDLIEAGVEILDPVQISASDMEPAWLAEQFGGDIVFHGGIDTQHVLPFASPEEVAIHCRHVVKLLSEKSGYIASGSQILGEDIPLENILALYSCLGEMKKDRE